MNDAQVRMMNTEDAAVMILSGESLKLVVSALEKHLLLPLEEAERMQVHRVLHQIEKGVESHRRTVDQIRLNLDITNDEIPF